MGKVDVNLLLINLLLLLLGVEGDARSGQEKLVETRTQSPTTSHSPTNVYKPSVFPTMTLQLNHTLWPVFVRNGHPNYVPITVFNVFALP